ncbi:MAG: DoxX family membrane protein [Bradymonadales bacterium]|nr:DoxX family membrane protein [Bradymonadales bacterium]
MSSRFQRFRQHPAHSFIAVPIRILVGVVFIYASWYKLAEPRDFAISIAMYEMLPIGLINLMAITLPAIELVAGITLIAGLWTKESAFVVNGMLVMFIIAICYVVFVRGEPNFGCGCFSPAAEAAEEEMATGTLIRDIWYLVGCGYVQLFDDGALGIDGLWRWRRTARV